MARKVEGYSLLLLEVVIIFLNTLAIIVIYRFKKKYNPDILIFSLAVADLLKALIPLNMTLVAYLSEKGMAERSPSCMIFGWTAFTLNSGIMLVMTVMAIDRYVAICWPFQYKLLLSKKRLIYTIIAVFIFSGTHSVLPLVGIGKMRSYNNGSFCHFDFDSTKPANQGYNIFVLVLGISMLVVVIFCYTRAMFSVRGLMKRQRRMSTATRDINGADRNRQAMNRMFARLMIVMMVAFCLSWLLFLVVVLQHVSGWFQIAPGAHFWSMRLAVINSVLNPLIGAVMCKPYRKGYLFIICKCLHCCGLCSSYKADDPWTRSRKTSSSSRNGSFEREPNTPTTIGTALGVKNNPSFSCQDSGIVPDSSIGYHQGGMINAAYGMDLSQAGGTHYNTGGGRIKERPRLQRKRISFKDEMEAKQAGLSLEEKDATAAMACRPDETTSPQQQFTESLPNHPDTSQAGGSCLAESDNGNTILINSKGNQYPSVFKHVLIDSSKRNRKHGYAGDNPCTLNQESSVVSKPNNSSTPFSSRVDESLTEDNTTTKKEMHEVKTPISNALIDIYQLYVSNRDTTLETLPKDPSGRNELKLSEVAKVTDISVHCQSTPLNSHTHGSALPQALQITYFPVGTNSDTKTSTVKSSKLSNFQGSQSSQKSPPLFSRSDSFLERTHISSFPGIKPRSQSFANDSQVYSRDINIIMNTPENTTQKRDRSYKRQCCMHPVTGPLFNSHRPKSSFTRTKSFDSVLRKKPHNKFDSTTSCALDLSPLQRHSSVLTGEQSVKGIADIRGHSESDLTRPLPETILISPHGTQHSFRRYAAKEQRDLFTNTGFYKENGNITQRRVSDPHITRPSSKIYKELKELSPKEMDREVFC